MGLDTVEILWKIERHFAISISNEEAAEAATVQEIYEMILRHLPANTEKKIVYEDLRKIIADQAGLDVDEIQPHHSLTNDLGLD